MVVNIQQSIFSQVADFLVSQPTFEMIAAYQAPEAMQQRMSDLLEKNREEGLNADEREEMQQFLAVSHLMTLAKAKARLKLTDEA